MGRSELGSLRSTEAPLQDPERLSYWCVVPETHDVLRYPPLRPGDLEGHPNTSGESAGHDALDSAARCVLLLLNLPLLLQGLITIVAVDVLQGGSLHRP